MYPNVLAKKRLCQKFKHFYQESANVFIMKQ